MTVREIRWFLFILKHLTENGNEDVCEADCAGNAVVVFGSSGDFQFMYKENETIQYMHGFFKPLHVANDTNSCWRLFERFNSHNRLQR